MSNWTDHTIIVKKEHKKLFDKEFKTFSKDFGYRLSNYELMYDNDEICVIGFDCNGDNPWYQREGNCPFLMVAIYYCDNMCPLIEYYDKKGKLHETSRTSLKRALSRFVPKEDYDALCEQLWPTTRPTNELTIWHTKRDINKQLKIMSGCHDIDSFYHRLSAYFGCSPHLSEDSSIAGMKYVYHIVTPRGITFFIVAKCNSGIVTSAYMYDPANFYRCPSIRK